MRTIISIAFSLILFSCSRPETEQERIQREIREAMEKLDSKIKDVNFDETKKALDKFEKEMTEDVQVKNISSEDLKRGYIIENGDTITVKVSAYDPKEN